MTKGDQKDKQQRKTGVMTGGKKSTRWSSRTRENKARRETRRLARLVSASERRRSQEVVNPSTGHRFRGGPLSARLKARFDQDVKIEKKADTRHRLKSLHPNDAKLARARGERQFESKAPEYHRLRISPAKYAELKKIRPRKSESPLAALKR